MDPNKQIDEELYAFTDDNVNLIPNEQWQAGQLRQPGQPGQPDTSETRFLTVDDFIEEVGSCGIYQKVIGLFICIINIPMTYQILMMYFTGHSPNWKCVNGTNSFCNFTGEITPAEVGKFKSRCSMPRDSWDYVTSKKFSLISEFDLVCDDNPLAAFANSALYIGWGIGCVPLGIAADYFGRKPVLFMSFLISMLSVFATGFVTEVWQFIILRAITGFGITGNGISAFVLSTELVGKKHRSLMGNCFFVVGTGALLLLTLQAYYIREWRTLTILCSAPYLAIAFLCFCFRESPRWLSSQGKLRKSMENLKKIAKVNRRPFPLAQLEQSSNIRKNRGSFINLFRPKRRLLITVALAFGWMIVAMTFYGISLSSGDLTGNMYRDFALMSLIEFPSMPLTVFLLEKIGRKKTTVGAMICAGLFCCSIVIFPEKSVHKIYPALRVVGGMAGKLCNVIAFSGYYLWTAELHPTAIRTQGMSFASLFARVGCSASPFISEVLKLVFPALPFVLMGVLSILAGLLSLFLPETRGQSSIESIDDVDDGSSRTKRFDLPLMNTQKLQEDAADLSDGEQDVGYEHAALLTT